MATGRQTALPAAAYPPRSHCHLAQADGAAADTPGTFSVTAEHCCFMLHALLPATEWLCSHDGYTRLLTVSLLSLVVLWCVGLAMFRGLCGCCHCCIDRGHPCHCDIGFVIDSIHSCAACKMQAHDINASRHPVLAGSTGPEMRECLKQHEAAPSTHLQPKGPRKTPKAGAEAPSYPPS